MAKTPEFIVGETDSSSAGVEQASSEAGDGTVMGLGRLWCPQHTVTYHHAWAFQSAQLLSEAQNHLIVGVCHFSIWALCTDTRIQIFMDSVCQLPVL